MHEDWSLVYQPLCEYLECPFVPKYKHFLFPGLCSCLDCPKLHSTLCIIGAYQRFVELSWSELSAAKGTPAFFILSLHVLTLVSTSLTSDFPQALLLSPRISLMCSKREGVLNRVVLHLGKRVFGACCWLTDWEVLLTYHGLQTRMLDPCTSLPHWDYQTFMCAYDYLSRESNSILCRNSKYFWHGFNRS